MGSNSRSCCSSKMSCYSRTLCCSRCCRIPLLNLHSYRVLELSQLLVLVLTSMKELSNQRSSRWSMFMDSNSSIHLHCHSNQQVSPEVLLLVGPKECKVAVAVVLMTMMMVLGMGHHCNHLTINQGHQCNNKLRLL